ncbi:hypothetical protein Lal_00033501 [Lupinus albus]|nr:hypothetical protein Lal_00033501 [Lupinus albus]
MAEFGLKESEWIQARGKWTPNYEGSFVVKKAFSGGALIMATMDGNNLPLAVNSDVVKKYYA